MRTGQTAKPTDENHPNCPICNGKTTTETITRSGERMETEYCRRCEWGYIKSRPS